MYRRRAIKDSIRSCSDIAEIRDVVKIIDAIKGAGGVRRTSVDDCLNNFMQLSSGGEPNHLNGSSIKKLSQLESHYVAILVLPSWCGWGIAKAKND